MKLLYLAHCIALSVWGVWFLMWLISYIKYCKQPNNNNRQKLLMNLTMTISTCLIQTLIGLVIFIEFK